MKLIARSLGRLLTGGIMAVCLKRNPVVRDQRRREDADRNCGEMFFAAIRAYCRESNQWFAHRFVAPQINNCQTKRGRNLTYASNASVEIQD